MKMWEHEIVLLNDLQNLCGPIDKVVVILVLCPAAPARWGLSDLYFMRALRWVIASASRDLAGFLTNLARSPIQT